MPISPQTSTFLQQSGYHNYCFVSYAYPGSDDDPMAEFARTIKEKLEEELRNRVYKPRVFLFNQHIPVGAKWEPELKENLVGSLTMVAILSGIYFIEQHKWCGKEWAAMDKLWAARFSDYEESRGIQPIIPVLYRKDIILPELVASRQCIDMSRVALSGRKYFQQVKFNEKIHQIIERIAEVAELVAGKQRQARVNDFDWPEDSPFTGDARKEPLAPNRGPTEPGEGRSNNKAKGASGNGRS